MTPEDHEERFTRALALVGCGATSEAIAEFETYLELRPQTEHRDTVLKLLAELRRGSP